VVPLLGTVRDNRRAILFRVHLHAAKLERTRLFEDTATTMAINFRSLRDSGITWEALASTPVDRIHARAGHQHIATTLGYAKAVENLRGKFGTPFGALPDALLESSRIVPGRFTARKPAKNKALGAPTAGLDDDWPERSESRRREENSPGLKFLQAEAPTARLETA
jgi:hypothetical protein